MSELNQEIERREEAIQNLIRQKDDDRAVHSLPSTGPSLPITARPTTLVPITLDIQGAAFCDQSEDLGTTQKEAVDTEDDPESARSKISSASPSFLQSGRNLIHRWIRYLSGTLSRPHVVVV